MTKPTIAESLEQNGVRFEWDFPDDNCSDCYIHMLFQHESGVLCEVRGTFWDQATGDRLRDWAVRARAGQAQSFELISTW